MLTTEPASVMLLIIIIWLVILTSLFFWLLRHYQRLVKGAKSENLQQILEKILSSQSVNSKEIKSLATQISKLNADANYNFRKMGLVRFNPFAQTGGDHSFCLALLDNKNTGIVVTSLHSRELTRFYIKPVKEGTSKHQLSNEEKLAIKKASI